MVVTLVQKYNPDWPKWFEEIKRHLGDKLSRSCVRIKHVGSMSIPEMTAKPIIDLILVINPKRFKEINALLEKRGDKHEGDLGIKGREAFKIEDDYLKNSLPTHHLYVCPRNSVELVKQSAFRDFLKQNKTYATRLSKMKWTLAERYDNDRQVYIEGKDELYREITRIAMEQKYSCQTDQ